MRDVPDRGSHSLGRHIYQYNGLVLPCLFSHDPEALVSSLFPFTLAVLGPIIAVELCRQRDAISSMNMFRGSSSDLSASSASQIANRASFLQQDRRRRRAAALRISISIDITNQCTPHSPAKIAASQQPRRRHPPRYLDLDLDLEPRPSNLLAVEAPLKRRRKQVLLLPTNPPHPP